MRKITAKMDHRELLAPLRQTVNQLLAGATPSYDGYEPLPSDYGLADMFTRKGIARERRERNMDAWDLVLFAAFALGAARFEAEKRTADKQIRDVITRLWELTEPPRGKVRVYVTGGLGNVRYESEGEVEVKIIDESR